MSEPTGHHLTRVFISHASADLPLVEELIDLLEMVGLTHEQIFCTSYPEYGIEPGEDFLNSIKNELIGTKTLVLFLLSKAFYSSPFCFCEMGATWVLAKEHIPILVPPLNFSDVKGVFPLTQGFKLNEPLELTRFKARIESAFGLRDKCGQSWERRRNKVIHRINAKITDGYGELPVAFDPESNQDAIEFIGLRCIPENPIRGRRIALVYEFESKIEGLRVWFGANLERDGISIYETDEDTEQVLIKGWQVHQRYLSIPAHIEPGLYNLHAEIWYGERSKPDLSVALVGRWPDRTLTLE